MNKKKKEIELFTREDLFKALVFHQTVFEYAVTHLFPTYLYVTNFYSVLKEEFPADVADALFFHIHHKTFKEKYDECRIYDMNAWQLGQDRQAEMLENWEKMKRGEI